MIWGSLKEVLGLSLVLKEGVIDMSSLSVTKVLIFLSDGAIKVASMELRKKSVAGERFCSFSYL